MTFKLLHCWDCGVQVISGIQGQYTPLPAFRQVRFGLADGSYCESPFCESCAQKEWTWERLKEFEAAVNRVTPVHHITVLTVKGHAPLQIPILAVLDPTQMVT